MSGLKVRECGALHPDGVPCVLSVYYEKGCCTDKVFPHEEPHEAVRDGVVTHRWEEVTKVMDLPFDAYSPRNSDSAQKAAKEAREQLESK